MIYLISTNTIVFLMCFFFQVCMFTERWLLWMVWHFFLLVKVTTVIVRQTLSQVQGQNTNIFSEWSNFSSIVLRNAFRELAEIQFRECRNGDPKQKWQCLPLLSSKWPWHYKKRENPFFRQSTDEFEVKLNKSSTFEKDRVDWCRMGWGVHNQPHPVFKVCQQKCVFLILINDHNTWRWKQHNPTEPLNI